MFIISAADERFAPHFATMMHSAWTHNPHAHFYLLECGITPETLRKLAAFASDNAIKFTSIQIDMKPLEGMPTTTAWSKAIYARLFMAELMPRDADRAIYLDSDCVVLQSLDRLWEMDVGKFAVAGVCDPYGRSHSGIDFYINSGVMLVNLKVWGECQIGALSRSFVKEFKPRAPDQTAINIFCQSAGGGIKYIEEGWNFMLGAAWRKPTVWIEPRILHCTGYAKPWLFSDVLFAPLYDYHRRQTPFPLPERPRYRSSIRHFLNLLIGRRKYWYRQLQSRRINSFVDSYLSTRLAARGGLPVAQTRTEAPNDHPALLSVRGVAAEPL